MKPEGDGDGDVDMKTEEVSKGSSLLVPVFGTCLIK